MTEVKSLLSKYCPSIYSIIAEDNRYFNKIQTKFEDKLKGLKVGDQTENSIVLLLGLCELEDKVSCQFLKLIDEVIKGLNQHLTGNLNKTFVKMIKNLVQEFDKQPIENLNPSYLNWFGEIIALSSIIKSDEYELIAFETKLENNKCIDFLFRDKKGEKLNIEVLNIHIPTEKAETMELLELTINSKLEEKLSAKTKGLQDIEGIWILPILWYETESQNQILSYIKRTDFNSMISLSPCALLKVNEEYKFGKINSFFPDE